MSIIKVVGLDIETTGLKVEDGHKIIEICIGAYRYETETGELTKVGNFWTQRINPGRDIDPKAYAVHKISLADLMGKPTWEQVAPKVSKFLEWCGVGVAHNANFDFPFIGYELVRIGMDIPALDIVDTMQLGKTATPLGTAPSLQALAAMCDEEYDTSKAHAAEYDVEVMMNSFAKCLKWGVFEIAVPGLQAVEEQEVSDVENAA
jgi:DNA polymerase-3 subunit epsilon